MSADNRDPFALARQGEGDAEIFAAEREYAEHERRYAELSKAKRLTDEEVDALADENSRLQNRVYTTAPTTVAGAVIKLRHFIDSPAGQGGLGVEDEAVFALEQI